MKRGNVGCGTVQPRDWINIDRKDYGQEVLWDVQSDAFISWLPADPLRDFDLLVANHLLSCFSHHELLGNVLPNLRSALRPGGVLRILVPDAEKAIRAYMAGDTEWFPLGDDLPDIGERLCTYLPWFGESKSIFVYEYLRGLLRDSGFISVTPALECGQSLYAPTEWEAGSLDDRCRMSLIVEALK